MGLKWPQHVTSGPIEHRNFFLMHMVRLLVCCEAIELPGGALIDLISPCQNTVLTPPQVAA
jgi:hypothetical protein